jgi:putative glutamine amidotransferase
MTFLPRIGITLDWEEKGSFSSEPYYCLRTQYFDAIHAAGGLPLAIPYLYDAINDYLDTIQGLVIPGGDFAFPNDWYLDSKETSPFPPSARLEFDIAIIKRALERRIPLLTICAGMQILACLNGCKLTNSIHTSVDHHGVDRKHPAHTVTITPQTKLANILHTTSIEANSAHREAIVMPSSNVTINAIAPDGTIEGIELDNHNFAIGVQWHPEFFVASANPHRMLFEALIKQSMHS